MIRTLTVVSLVFALTACENMDRRQRSTAIGAGVGAAVGAVATDSALGTAAGAAVGGVIGNQVGKDKDNK